MDASQAVDRFRNISVYDWSIDAVNKPTFLSHQDLLKKRLGELALSQTPTPPAESASYSVDSAVALVMESIFLNVAQNNIGPTLTARYMYLFMFTVTSAYQWVSSSKIVSGAKDSYDWDVQYTLSSDDDVFIWMNHVMAYVMTAFTPTSNPPSFYPYGASPGTTGIANPPFDTTQLLANERKTLKMSVAQQARAWTRVQALGHFSEWQTAWIAWYTGRQADGYVVAQTPLPLAETPNQHGGVATTLNVSVPTIIAENSDYPNPTQWTSLFVGGKKKSYYCYNFSDTSSTCLSPTEFNNITSATSAFFPTTEQRTAELATLVQTTSALTDRQKVTAEFWAAGPYTVSPPGMFVYLWRQTMMATQFAERRGLPAFFASGLSLTANLFEVGRVVWALKKQFMQARPIQDVRRLYAGQTLTKYDGTSVQGESWVPYQAPNFVTPPFADFPSGHSAFSQVFANTMTAWMGTTIPKTTPTPITDLGLLSPTFMDPHQSFPPTFPFTSYAETQPVLTFVMRRHASEVQPGVVPAAPITLSWNTWQEVANSAGLSRQYGGIHAMSAHTASQSAANMTFAIVQNRWGFHP